MSDPRVPAEWASIEAASPDADRANALGWAEVGREVIDGGDPEGGVRLLAEGAAARLRAMGHSPEAAERLGRVVAAVAVRQALSGSPVATWKGLKVTLRPRT